MTDHVDGTAEEVGTDIIPAAPTPSTLFHTDDPVEVVQRASSVAAALKDVLQRQGMVQRIQNKDYVRVEGWQTLGSMLGVVPVVAWTREVEGGWEARVEARTLDGRVVGAAEAMCVASEGGNWGQRATSNARRSMAQTRAVSKALRGPLGFVVTLAGYEATPADEMPTGDSPAPAPAASRVSDVQADTAKPITPELRQKLLAAYRVSETDPVSFVELLDRLGVPRHENLDQRVAWMTVGQGLEAIGVMGRKHSEAAAA